MLTKINNIDFSDQLGRNSKIGLRHAHLHHWTHLMQKTASNLVQAFPSYSADTKCGHTHTQTDNIIFAAMENFARSYMRSARFARFA